MSNVQRVIAIIFHKNTRLLLRFIEVQSMETFTSYFLASHWQYNFWHTITHHLTNTLRTLIWLHETATTNILHFSHRPYFKRHCILSRVGKVCSALYNLYRTPYVSTGRCLLQDNCVVGCCWMAQQASAKIEIWKASWSSCTLSHEAAL